LREQLSVSKENLPIVIFPDSSSYLIDPTILQLLKGVVKSDEKGYVLSGPYLMYEGQQPEHWRLDHEPFFLETSVPGIFAAGVVRHNSIKRVATGVGEGQWPFSLSIATWASEGIVCRALHSSHVESLLNEQ
jgi:hypothetical protein